LKFNFKENLYNSKPFIFLLGLFFLILLGILAPILNLLYLPVIAGLAFSVSVIYLYIHSVEKKRSILIVSGFALALALWVIGVVWGRGCLNPLFFEKIVLGRVNGDNIYHIDIVSMIKNHWIPSTGLDGLPYLKYHWGSHYFFAQISKLLRLDAINFYNLAYPVLFAPFVVRSFMYLISSVKKLFKVGSVGNWTLYMLLVFAFAGILPTDFTQKVGIYTFAIFQSESYSLGLAFSFIVLGLFFQLKRQLDEKIPTSGIGWFFLVFVPFILGLIGMLKISLFVLLMIVLGFFFIRLKLYRKTLLSFSAVLCLVAAAIVYNFSYTGQSQFHLFYSIKYYVNADLRILFPVLYFFWVWIYLIIKLSTLKVKTLKDIGKLLSSRKILDLELLLLVSVAGLVPVLFIAIPGAGAFFFSDFQRWLALSFIIATMSFYWPKKFLDSKIGFSTLKVAAFGFILVIAFFSYNSIKNIRDGFLYKFVFSNITTRNQLSLKNGDSEQAVSSKFSQPQKNLQTNNQYRLIKMLREQSQVPDKNITAIFIAQDNVLYWNLIEYGNVQFVGPSLSGLPLIGGIQPFIPPEMNEKTMEDLIAGTDSEQKQNIKTFYKTIEDVQKDGLNETKILRYKLRSDLSTDEKKEAYDLISPKYYSRLSYRGYEAYNLPEEAKYLENFSSDEKICEQAIKKNFSKVIIIGLDKQDIRSREINCNS
jgi:hypothetical protein